MKLLQSVCSLSASSCCRACAHYPQEATEYSCAWWWSWWLVGSMLPHCFIVQQEAVLCCMPWMCWLQVFHCADAFATIVVVDAVEGRPSHIPFELQPATEEEKLRLEVSQLHCAALCLTCQVLAALCAARASSYAALCLQMGARGVGLPGSVWLGV